MPPTNFDPHGPYVSALVQSGDWAALVRYWIAHDYTAALERAIALLRLRAGQGDSHWDPLVAHLQRIQAAPLHQGHEAPDSIAPHLDKPQKLTLQLLSCYPRALLCRNLLEVQPDQQSQVFQAAFESAQQAVQTGFAASDSAIAAFFLNVLGNGLHTIRQLDPAVHAYSDALQLYRQLAEQRPDVYRPEVAGTLNDLGNVLADLNRLEAAHDQYREALVVWSDLAGQRPEVYRQAVAMTLTNLGTVLADLNQLEAARERHQEGLDIYRELAAQRPKEYRPQLASSLNNLAGVLRDLKQLDASHDRYQEALAICYQLAEQRPDVYRPQLARVLNNLGTFLRELNQLESACDRYQEALGIRRQLAEERPEVYRPALATTLSNLGNVLCDLNELEAARDLHQEALAIRRQLAEQQPEVYQPDLAMTFHNLGHVLKALNEPESAHDRYQAALAIWCPLAEQRPEAYRSYLADTLNNLGNVLHDLNQLEEARARYEHALAIRRELAEERPGVYRPEVALTLSNLGNLLNTLNRLEEARNRLEEALAIRYELAEERPEVYRPGLAISLINLGNTLGALKKLEAARDHYQEALGVYRSLLPQQPEVYRSYLAGALNNLGVVLRELKQLEEARARYEEALAIRRQLAAQRPELHCPDLALTLNNLSLVFADLSQLELARDRFREALAIYRQLRMERPEAFSAMMASTLNNLSTVLRDLGELEDARERCEEALGIRRHLAIKHPEVYESDVAASLNNLAGVLRDLSQLELARDRYEEALAIRRHLAGRRPEVHRPEDAQTAANLGTVLHSMNQLEGAHTRLREALDCFRQLAEERPEVYLPLLAGTLHNLGNLLKDLNELDEARDRCEEALAIRRRLAERLPEANSPHVAATLNMLGCVQCLLEDFDSAATHYEQAAQFYEDDARQYPNRRLVERVLVHMNLARLVRRKGVRSEWPDYQAARRHLELACQCAERYRGMFRSVAERKRVQADAYDAFELHVCNCIDVWSLSVRDGKPEVEPLHQAVWAAEASRSRRLLDMLANAELRPVLAPPPLKAEYARLRQNLERSWLLQARQQRAEETGPGEIELGTRGLAGITPVPQPADQSVPRPCGSPPDVLLEVLQQQEQEMAALVERIRHFDPEFDPRQGGGTVECQAIEALIPSDPRTVFVQYAIGREQSVAFVLLGQNTGEIRPVLLPESAAEAIDRAQAKWFQAYDRWRSKHVPPEVLDREWHNHTQRVLEELSAAALMPVLRALPDGVERLVISPHQNLHVFPLHACPIDDNTPLGEQFEVVYTPSFSLLHRCAQRRPEGGGEALLVECPDGMSAQPLPFARVECAALRRRLRHVRRIVGREATAESVASAGRECSLLHYCGHSRFDERTPLKSELMLSGEPITLEQVFDGVRLPRNRLVVLSGCESGLLVPEVLDDYVSLATGFLYAGAPCVVSTLWENPDLSSALLMDKFYEQWLAGTTPAGALRSAQRWLRSVRTGPELDRALEALTDNLDDPTEARRCREIAASYVEGLGEHPFACPVHWAAFTCSGVGYAQPGTPEPHTGQSPLRTGTCGT